MVISSILLSMRNAYIWAIFTIIMESTLFYLEHHHHIPSWHFFPFYPEGLVNSGTYVFLTAVAFSVTILITVYFATTIVRPIRKRQLDLTELQIDLQKQKAELELKNKELQELDHSKTEFLYRVEHELKAPIGALQSLLSVVSRGYSSVSDEKKKEFLARAGRRVSTMKDLVTDLLSLSRVSERSFQLELETLRLETLTKEVIDELGVYAGRKGVDIKTNFAEPLPEIRADKQAMLEVTRNLVHNAVKYSFQGEVNVTLTSLEKQVIFKVEDSGIGISEEDLGNIFKEFYRSANAKAFEEGTGLGLSLVKYLIERHGGTITVSSQLDKGTTFTVTLPVH
jgi:signal transduction histidine kinase